MAELYAKLNNCGKVNVLEYCSTVLKMTVQTRLWKFNDQYLFVLHSCDTRDSKSLSFLGIVLIITMTKEINWKYSLEDYSSRFSSYLPFTHLTTGISLHWI